MDGIEELFKQHSINYKRIINDDIVFEHMLKSYRIQLSEDADGDPCYNLLEGNGSRRCNSKHKFRERRIKSFYGDNIIFKVLEYVENKGVKECNLFELIAQIC